MLWWRNIFVLAVKVVLSAELARLRFVALLLASSIMVASLSSPDLLSLSLNRQHVCARAMEIRLSILLARRLW
jgi:hypothetical protein